MSDWEASVGAVVVAARKRLKLTQRELAEKMGCHTCQVSFWETGRMVPTTGHLRALCLCLGISADTVLGLPTGDREG